MVDIVIFSILITTVYSCTEPLDLVFLIDGSNGVNSSDFIQQKAFVSSQTMEYSVSHNKVKIAVLLYSGIVWETIDFKESENEDAFISKVSTMSQPFGDLFINNALKSVRELFHSENRPGARRIAVLITTGRSNRLWETFKEARQLSKYNIVLYAVGVGHGISRNELTGLTSDRNNVLTVDTFNSLFSLSRKLHELICPGYQKSSVQIQSEESVNLFKPQVELSIFNSGGLHGPSLLPQRKNLIDNVFLSENFKTKSKTDQMSTQNQKIISVPNIAEAKNMVEVNVTTTVNMKSRTFTEIEKSNSIQRRNNVEKNTIINKDTNLLVSDVFHDTNSSKSEAVKNSKDIPAVTMVTMTEQNDTIKKQRDSVTDVITRLKSSYTQRKRNQREKMKNKNFDRKINISTPLLLKANDKENKLSTGKHESKTDHYNIYPKFKTTPVYNESLKSLDTSKQLDVFSEKLEVPEPASQEISKGPVYKIKSVWEALLDDVDLKQVMKGNDGTSLSKMKTSQVMKGTKSFEKHKNNINVDTKVQLLDLPVINPALDLDNIVNGKEKIGTLSETSHTKLNTIEKNTSRTASTNNSSNPAISFNRNSGGSVKPLKATNFDEKTGQENKKVKHNSLGNSKNIVPWFVSLPKTTSTPTTTVRTTISTTTLPPSTSTTRQIIASVPKSVKSTTKKPKLQQNKKQTADRSLKDFFGSRKSRPLAMDIPTKSKLNGFGQSKDITKQITYLLDFLILEHDRMIRQRSRNKNRWRKEETKVEKITKQPIQSTVTPSVIWENRKAKEDDDVDKYVDTKRIKNSNRNENWGFRRPAAFLPGKKLGGHFTENLPLSVQGVSENEHCSLVPFEKDASFYLETTENRTVLRPCPEGTAFDIRSCACTIRTTFRGQADCDPEIALDFETDTQDKSGKNIHVGSHQVELSNGSAIFNGNSDLTIWRFTGSHIGHHLMIRARFKARKHPEIKQYIISNCQTPSDISYGIEIDRFKEVVVFTLDTEPRDKKEIEMPFKLDDWTNVGLMYDGLKFIAMVNDQSKSIPLAGDVETRSTPLRIGGCGTKNHGFYGLIDEISLSFCIPRIPRRIK